MNGIRMSRLYRGTPRFINMQHDNSMATLLYANHKILFLI